MATGHFDPNDETSSTVITAAGWTARETTAATPSIVSMATPNGDRAIRQASGTDTDENQFGLWTLDAVPSHADTEMVVLMRRSTASDLMVGVGTRGADWGNESLRTAYVGAARNNTTDGRIFVYNGAKDGTDVGTPQAHGIDTTAWFWMRLRVNGTTLQLRMWQDGAAEPGTWLLSETDSLVSAAGYSGIYAHIFATTSPTVDWAWFGWGTEGDTAPKEASANALATPTGFTFTKTTDVAEVTGSWSAVTDAASYDYEVEEWDGAAWQAFAVSSVTAPTTTFTLDDTDGVQFSTLYRARVRAVPAV